MFIKAPMQPLALSLSITLGLVETLKAMKYEEDTITELEYQGYSITFRDGREVKRIRMLAEEFLLKYFSNS